MKAGELIEKLQAAIAEHGDLEVVDSLYYVIEDVSVGDEAPREYIFLVS